MEKPHIRALRAKMAEAERMNYVPFRRIYERGLDPNYFELVWEGYDWYRLKLKVVDANGS